jgi:hypothetical protein
LLASRVATWRPGKEERAEWEWFMKRAEWRQTRRGQGG